MRLKLAIMTAIMPLAVSASSSATAATWAGVAQSNVLVNSKCTALHYTLAIEGNKVKLHLGTVSV